MEIAYMKTKLVSTKRNEQSLERVLNIVLSATDCSPEFKLAFKTFTNNLITDIRERGISTFHSLIDYLHDKANQDIDRAGNLTLDQKIYWKCVTRMLAELAKLRHSNKRSFWPGKHRNRIRRFPLD